MICKFTLKSSYDDLDLSVIEVMPSGHVQAILQISHGLCGSKERFLPFMEFMASNGVACVANDHRGHGKSIKSSEDLGYMYDGGADALLDDMRTVYEWIVKKYTDVPAFILGHSMGSLAVRAFIRKYPVVYNGVLICGSPVYNPMASLGYEVSSLLCRLGLERLRPVVMHNLMNEFYNRKFASEGLQAWICSDSSVRNAFQESPEHNFILTLNGSKALLDLMVRTYSHSAELASRHDSPVIFLAGEDDPCTGGSYGLHKAISAMRESGYGNITLKVYPAMRHEVLNEIGKECVWQDILNFIGI